MSLRYPCWPNLPALVARLAFIRAQRENVDVLEEFPDEVARSQWVRTWKSANYKASSLPVRDVSTYGQMPLQEFLIEFHKEVESAVPEAELHAHLRSFRESLSNSVRQFGCQSCSIKPACLLRGSSHFRDDEALSGDSACLTDLRNLFDAVRQTVHAIYNKFGGRAPTEIVVPGISHYEFKNGSNVGGFSVSGRTYRPMEIASRRTYVDLLVDSDSYSREDYFGTLYVLLHEWFCHAYSGQNPGGADRLAGDSYADGWMDYVACELLPRIIDGEFGAECQLRIPIEFSEHFSNMARTLHYGRTKASSEAISATWTYSKGASAAQRFFLLCQKIFQSEGDGLELLLRFSCSINISNISHADRGSLVSWVNVCLAKMNKRCDPTQSVSNEIIQAIKKYKEGGGWSILFDAFKLSASRFQSVRMARDVK